MAKLPGKPAAASLKLTSQNQARPDTGAHRYEEYILRASRRAASPFPIRGDIGIVVDNYWKISRAFKLRVQVVGRNIDEIRARFDSLRSLVYESRPPNAHSRDAVSMFARA